MFLLFKKFRKKHYYDIKYDGMGGCVGGAGGGGGRTVGTHDCS